MKKQIRNLFGVAAIALAIVISMAVMPLTGCSNPTDSGGGKTVDSIEVTTQPTKDTHNIGDELDTAGMVVTATYTDGTKAEVTGYTISGYDKNTAGEQTVTVTYKKKTATFTVTVVDPNSTVTLTGIAVTTQPDKKEYFTGETLDTTGMVVTATYSDSTTAAVTVYTTSGFDSATAGTKTVTVTYQGKTATFTVTVTVRPIVATPTATPAGGTLIASGTVITLATATDGAEIWYTTNGSAPAKNGAGSTKFTNPFAITTLPTTVKAIAVKDGWTDSAVLTADYGSAHITVADISITAPAKNATPADKVFNQPQERFTEGTVTWIPSHSKFQGETVYTATVTLTAKPGFTFAGLTSANVKVNGDPATISNNTGAAITVSHGFPATDKKVVSGITIKSQPTKLAYNHGDKLDLAGLAVTLTYDDDTTKDIAAADFSAQNIATDPGHDIPLERFTYNGKAIKITYGNLTPQNTSALTVNPVDASHLTIDAIAAQTYNGDEITPAITVKYPVSTGTARDLVLGTDYTAEYADNVNAGEATVTITGMGDYTGTKDATFTINKANPVTTWPTASDIQPGQKLSDSTFSESQAVAGTFAWEDDTIAPEIGTHTYKVTFTPSDEDNYLTVSNDVSITVANTPITAADISITAPVKNAVPATAVSNQEQERFTSETVTWEPNDSAFKTSTVYTATVTLKAKAGYTFAGLNDSNVKVNGQAATTVTINDDNDTLTLTYTFAITADKAVSGIAIKTQPAKLTYTHGDTLELAGLVVTLTYDDHDHTTEDAAPTDFTAKNITAAPANGIPLEKRTYDGKPVKITIGSLTKDTNNLTVSAKSVSELNVDAITAQTYSGTAITPALAVKHTVPSGTTRTLALGTDYTVAYTSNTGVGTATATITGKDDYTGTKAVTFTINAKNITDSNVSISGGTTTKPYTGAAITQDIIVRFGTGILTKDTDYTVTYDKNTNAGTADVTITGKGNFTGATTVHFTISKATPVLSSLTATEITYGKKLSDSTIGGSATNGGTTVAGAFTWDAPNTIPNVGSFEYDVTFKPTDTSNYNEAKGKLSITVNKIDLSGYYVKPIDNQEYTGIPIDPVLTVKATVGADDVLTKNTDYTVAYTGDNTNVGTVTVTITGAGNYTGTISGKSFTIVARNVEHLTIEPIADKEYTGSAIEPEVTVKFGETPLLGTDYTVAYGINTDAGPATVTISGVGNYTGTRIEKFKIIKDIDHTDITVEPIPDWPFDDESDTPIEPEVTVKDGAKTLTKDIDYTVAYSNNTGVTTEEEKATVTITGKGYYTGTKEAKFNITDIPFLTIAPIDAVTYDGTAQKPALTVKFGKVPLTLTTDYTVEYKNNTDAGTAMVTITGINDYADADPATATFTINPKDASGLTIEAIDAVTYNSSAIEPTVTVKDDAKTLTLTTDYTVEYDNNTNAGTAKVTITGKGNYTGTKDATFTINPKDASLLAIDPITAVTYNGTAKTPTITVKDGLNVLAPTTNFTVAYSDNTNAGTATVTITGVGNYTGDKGATFTINAKLVSTLTIDPIAEVTYKGTPYTPTVTVKDNERNLTLTLGTDYTVAYDHNTNAGTADVTITGVDNYTGTATVHFTINKASGAAVVPKLVSKTINSITVNVVTTPASGQTVEYAINTTNTAPSSDSDWKPGTTFSSLNEGTPYYIFARTQGNANYLTGAASGSLPVTTLQTVSSERFEYFWVDQHGELITTSSNELTINAGETLIITAAAVGYKVEQWTLNGFNINPPNKDAYKFSTTAPGKHTIGLIVSKGGSLYNTNITVTVR